MVEVGEKWGKVGISEKNGEKWRKVAKSGEKWRKVGKSWKKLEKVEKSGKKWKSGEKWLGVAICGFMRLKVVLCG